MRGLRFRALVSPRSRRVGVAAAVALTLGGGLLSNPAGAYIDNVPGATVAAPNNTVATAPTVDGDQSLHETAFGTNPCPNPPPATATNGWYGSLGYSDGALPAITNLSVFTGTGTSTADAKQRLLLSQVRTATDTTFAWPTFRLPKATYHYRTSTQNRAYDGVSGGYALCRDGSAVAKTDPYYVNLANKGKIDSFSGAGDSGVSATVSARLVDGSHGDKVVKTGTASLALVNRVVGSTTYGSIGRNVSTLSMVGTGSTGLTSSTSVIYIDGVASDAGLGPAPEDQADNTTALYYNRLKVPTAATAGGPISGFATVECTNVFRNVPVAPYMLNGFSGCTTIPAASGFMTDATVITDAHVPATMTFTIVGTNPDSTPDPHSAVGVLDPATGIYTATVDTPNVAVGPAVAVSVSTNDDGFLTPASGGGNIEFKGGTNTIYDENAPTSAFWQESFTVRAQVVGKPVAAPATAGTVTFKLGSEESDPIAVDANGFAETTLTAIDPPAPGQKVVATYSGTPLYNASSTSIDFTTKPRPTRLVYTGPTSGNYNDTVTYSGKLTDVRSGDTTGVDANDAPLPGHPVVFKLGTAAAVTSNTGANGVATTTDLIKSNVGTYQLKTDYFALDGTGYVPSSDSDEFVVDYQYKFTDTLIGNGDSVLLNPDTQQVGFEQANGRRSRIANRSFQLSLYLPTVIGYPDTSTGPLPELPQEWTILNLPRLSDLFGLLGNPPALPAPGVPTVVPPAVPALPELPVGELPIPVPMAPASSRSAAAESGGLILPNITGGATGTPAATGGMTIGDLINGVTGAGIPVSLSACELLSGSTCERRFIIAATTRDPGPDVIGVFDVKTGLFASLVANTPGANPFQLLASLGSCVDDLPLCIALPALPSGLPSLAPPTLPDPSGLLDAIADLVAGLQGLPDQIEAPPAPPAPEVPETPSASASSPAPTGSLLSGPGNTVATLIPAFWLG